MCVYLLSVTCVMEQDGKNSRYFATKLNYEETYRVEIRQF